MKRATVGFGVGVLVALCACNNDAPSPPSSAEAADSGTTTTTTTGASSTDAGAEGVECSHPGAGKPIGGGRCECTTTRNIAGEWSSRRTCREGDLCTVQNKEDAIIVTQTGTTVRVDRADTYSISGVLCGDVVVWSGGPKDGLNPECGVLRLTDDAHFSSDSCFVAAGDCARTFADGCPTLKGQCTGLAAKKPEAAPSVKKVICN